MTNADTGWPFQQMTGQQPPITEEMARAAAEQASAIIPPKVERPRKKQAPSDVKGQELIDCPEHCGATQRRKNMRTHLMGIHQWERSAANQYAREARKSRHATLQKRRSKTRNRRPPASTPAVVHHRQQREPKFDYTAINPADIAIGVVQSQVNGQFPSNLLPEVISYVDHTRDLVNALRASRR